MEHPVGNIFIIILGISLGVMLSRYLYIWVKRERIVKTSNKAVVTIVNTFFIIVGLLVGFITVVIIYTILYLIVIGHE